jgi:adenine-specific DNA methylase
MAEEEIGGLYPADKDGNKPVAYYWTRVGTCANPACAAEVQLLKQFYLVNKKEKKVHLKPVIQGNRVDFEIKDGPIDIDGWNYRGNLKCPCCGNTTDVKQLKKQFLDKKITERLLAVIYETANGKEYRLPSPSDANSVKNISNSYEKPKEAITRGNLKNLTLPLWGIDLWADMFSARQLLAMQTLVNKLKIIEGELTSFDNDYLKVIETYLAILIDRLAAANTSYGIWHTSGEKLERIMSRQAIAMVFDYPESNPFCNSSGSAYNQIEWIIKYIESESGYPFSSQCRNSSSGDVRQFPDKYLSSVVTDPPYYNAIAYGDISDFFYVWLKKTIASVYPDIFAFPLTPKQDECTALKHHHNGDLEKAKQHFENKLQQIFQAIEQQTRGVISIMFAHQSTEAWTTLCNSILNANMNITGSWANDTEMTGALKTNKAFLSSSITVTCRPAIKTGFGDYKSIRQAIEQKIKQQVKHLFDLGFRGADLLTACFGQAVGEFGKYEKVEKADGTEVTVADLLEMTRQSAFNAIVSDIGTDDITRFYIGWLNLFGFTPASHDDVRRITQIGLNIDARELLNNTILTRAGNKESLAQREKRTNANPRLGETPTSPTIDKAHKTMHHLKNSSRGQLLDYITQHAPTPQHPTWRVLNSLTELLPPNSDDYKEAAELLAIKDNLIREARTEKQPQPKQQKLFTPNN